MRDTETGVQRASDAQGVPSLSDLQRTQISRTQPQGGLKSIPLDVNPFFCIPDGLYCLNVFSDHWKSERLLYAHVRALTVSHWMYGLKRLVDLFIRGPERDELDGCTNQLGVEYFLVYTRSPHGFSKLIGLFRRREAQPQRHRPGHDLRWLWHHIWIYKSPSEEKKQGKISLKRWLGHRSFNLI